MPVPKIESVYQRQLCDKLYEMFPGCFIMANDPDQYQGIPDLVILFENKWAMLEVKFSEASPRQPNQEHYVNMFNDMSFASFIYPENEEEVLEELKSRFGAYADVVSIH